MASSHRRARAPRTSKPKSLTLIGGLATLATGAAVVTGAAVADPGALDLAGDSSTTSLSTAQGHESAAGSAGAARRAADRREIVVSRSSDRGASVGAIEDLASDPKTVESGALSPVKRWTTETLDLWSAYGKHSTGIGEVEAGKQVFATGRTEGGRDEIVVDGKVAWVTHGYLSKKKPATDAPATGALSDAPCPDMSVENGLTAGTIKVYRAVCHAFPQVKDYIGLGDRTEHDTGNAIDVMVYDNKGLGDQIAAWAQAHAAEFDLYDLIWYDRIWTPVRSSEGWRDYGDHGSPTANHMDHVHIGTN